MSTREREKPDGQSGSSGCFWVTHNDLASFTPSLRAPTAADLQGSLKTPVWCLLPTQQVQEFYLDTNGAQAHCFAFAIIHTIWGDIKNRH